MRFRAARTVLALAILLAIVGAWVLGLAAAQLAWFQTTLDENGTIGIYPSHDIDASGRIHLVYLDAGTSAVKYAALSGGSWQFESVDQPGFVSGPTSLALDQLGRPYATYSDGTHLRLAIRDAQGWNVSIVDRTYGEFSSSVVIGRDGWPRIAYAWDTGPLRFATWDGSRWRMETVAADILVARHISLVLDGLDRPHISLLGNGNLRYLRLDGAQWFEEVVDSSGGAGWFSRLALDANGWPRIAYYDSEKDDLMFAAWSGVTRTWRLDVIDGEGDAGWDLDFVLGDDGTAHVSYYERTLGDLRYAHQRSDGWDHQTVDSGGVVGWYTSLALDRSGMPSVSYFDWTRGVLRFATSAVEFQVMTITAEGIALDEATLRGELASLGAFPLANLLFEWRAQGSATWNVTSHVTATTPSTYRIRIANLTSATLYEFRALGEANGSIVRGEILRFRTIAPPPPPVFPIVFAAVAAGAAIIGVLLTRRWVKRRADRERLRRKMARDRVPRP